MACTYASAQTLLAFKIWHVVLFAYSVFRQAHGTCLLKYMSHAVIYLMQ